MSKHYLLIYLIFIFFLSACSPSKHSLVIEEYNIVIKKGDIDDVIAALEQLVIIDKVLYQNKLSTAQTVKIHLDKAIIGLKNNKYFSAYLSSHLAYRLLPLDQSKKLIVVTGKKLLPLLKVQSKIKQSFLLTPKSIKNQLKKYQTQPVNDWGLIAVNQFIEKTNNTSKLLQDSLNLLNSISYIQKEPALLTWKKDIEQRLSSLIKTKKTLINLARHTSANVLLSLNDKLVEESTNMLSLIRPSLAKQSLKPLFIKAQIVYQPYQILNENLSLSDSTIGNNKHATWYNNWQEIEHAVLNVGNNLLEYPKKSPTRTQRLNFYKNKYNESKYLPKFKYQNENEFMSPHKKIQQIITTLAIDRIMINYGLATNLLDEI